MVQPLNRAGIYAGEALANRVRVKMQKVLDSYRPVIGGKVMMENCHAPFLGS